MVLVLGLLYVPRREFRDGDDQYILWPEHGNSAAMNKCLVLYRFVETPRLKHQCARSALDWQAQLSVWLVVTLPFAIPPLSDKARVCILFGRFHALIIKYRRQSERAVEYFATLVYGSGQTSTIVNAQRHRSLQFGPTSLRLVYMEHKASWM